MRQMDESNGKARPIAQAFEALYELVLYLRGENGCPWDKAQGLESIFDCIKEEAGELGEALQEGNFDGVSEEWGDTLFTCLMFSAIAEESGRFSPEQALRAIEAKMIRRHPHIFGSSSVSAVEEVLAQWDRIKAKEKRSPSESIMEDLPQFYSALKRAHHVQKLAAQVGFDWPDTAGILEKIDEEIAELRKAVSGQDEKEIEDELGDLLFSCVNLARFMGKDSETLLSGTIDKFIGRFKYMEAELKKTGKSTSEASLQEMDQLWEKAKGRHGKES